MSPSTDEPARIVDDTEPQRLILFLVDRSGSMYDVLPSVWSAVAEAIAAQPPNDRVAVIAFDTLGELIVSPQEARHHARIEEQLARVEAGGGTDIVRALGAARRVVEREDLTTRIVVFTDASTPAKFIFSAVSGQPESVDRVAVLVRGVGGETPLLKELGRVPRVVVRFVPTASELRAAMMWAVNEARDNRTPPVE